MNALADFFKRYANALQLLVIVAGFVVTNYLNANFVRRDDYDRDSNRLAAESRIWREEVTRDIRVLSDSINALKNAVEIERTHEQVRQDKMLEDHENRIRALEHSR